MTDADPIRRLNAALEGRYHIERQLGEGGMAMVYLARDEKHKRNVALKVLRPELAAVVGAERFLAEIETTANLQHPHILPLFDSGEADGFLFYVMPHVEGENLRERLDREHQLPVEEAVRIATAVAAALDYAHRQGVIHRDIKPANIMLHDGEPVVSDFGIALAVGAAGGGRLTETGLSLGTPHYMSPEQATGDQTVSGSSDVYALGCVLYEMLVGEPPYTGSTAQAVLGRIVTGDAEPVTKHRKSVPANIDAAVRKALEKVPADRFVSAQAFSKALADPAFRFGGEVGVGGAGSTLSPLVLGGYALAAVFAGGFAWALTTRQPAAEPEPVRRFAIDLPEGTVLRPNTIQPIGLSPDGETLILNAGTFESAGNDSRLYARPLGGLELIPIRGTEGIGSFFVSPEGDWIGLNSPDERLLRIPVDGGPASTIAETPGSFGGFRGATWSETGMIVYAIGSASLGLMRVRDVGGVPEPLTEVPEESGERHADPFVLPSGETVLFTVRRDDTPDEIAIVRVGNDEYEILTQGAFPHFIDGGFLVFQRDDDLWAARFDPQRGVLTSDPVPVLEDLRQNARAFAMSGDGTLVFAEALFGDQGMLRLVVIDLDGNETVLPLEPRDFGGVSVGWSPDGTTVAYEHDDHIYTYDVTLGTTPRQLTFEGDNERPVFSPSGTRVVFSSTREGTDGLDLFVKDLEDDAPPRLLASLEANERATQWPSDSLIVFERGAAGNRDLWMLDLSDPENPRAQAYLESEADLERIVVSPDGSLAAYRSDESGSDELYVRRFPNPGERTVISEGGGGIPYWAPDGNTLYYLTGPGEPLVAARLRRDPVPVVLSRETLPVSGPLGVEPFPGAALHPAGDRFVFALTEGVPYSSAADLTDRVILVQNFVHELERLLPLD